MRYRIPVKGCWNRSECATVRRSNETQRTAVSTYAIPGASGADGNGPGCQRKRFEHATATPGDRDTHQQHSTRATQRGPKAGMFGGGSHPSGGDPGALYRDNSIVEAVDTLRCRAWGTPTSGPQERGRARNRKRLPPP